MNVSEMQEIMGKYGIVIRPIPKIRRLILEECYIKEYPNGEVVYLEEFKRHMCVVKETPKHAEEFLFVFGIKHTMARINFANGKYFKSIEDGLRYAVENLKPID